jgi:hypothetical protein
MLQFALLSREKCQTKGGGVKDIHPLILTHPGLAETW